MIPDPGHSPSWQNTLAQVRQRLVSGDPGGAEQLCHRVLDAQTDCAEAHYNLGKALRMAGRVEETVQCYGAALELRPQWPEVHYDPGNALRAIGKPKEAEATYRQALRPDMPVAYLNRGLRWLREGRWAPVIVVREVSRNDSLQSGGESACRHAQPVWRHPVLRKGITNGQVLLQQTLDRRTAIAAVASVSRKALPR